jgi:nucleoside-diphosphate-sugar epimerase
MKKVLITGAEGTIGTAMREQLGERYEFSSITLTPRDFPSLAADIADLDAIQPAFEGQDAVVHMAADARVTAPWEDILHNNFIGTYNVFEAARRAGVECVVFASSNHAVGGYEVEGAPDIYALDDPRRIDQTVQIRPDSYYGVSKAFGEALGRYYVDAFKMRVFCLRIGWVRADDNPRPDVRGGSEWLDLRTPEDFYARLRTIWLSKRDCCQLIARCLDAEHIKYGIYYGMSDNPRKFWSLDNAREELGFAPQDSAPSDLG